MGSRTTLDLLLSPRTNSTWKKFPKNALWQWSFLCMCVSTSRKSVLRDASAISFCCLWRWRPELRHPERLLICYCLRGRPWIWLEIKKMAMGRRVFIQRQNQKNRQWGLQIWTKKEIGKNVINGVADLNEKGGCKFERKEEESEKMTLMTRITAPRTTFDLLLSPWTTLDSVGNQKLGRAS